MGIGGIAGGREEWEGGGGVGEVGGESVGVRLDYH